MPISYRIDVAKQRVFTSVSGGVTALDIVGHFEVARREGFLPFTELIDASSITEPTVSAREIGKAAMAVWNLQSGRKFGSRAVCVANDANFVLAQLFASLLSGCLSMKIFRSQIAAEDWLNNQSGKPTSP